MPSTTSTMFDAARAMVETDRLIGVPEVPVTTSPVDPGPRNHDPEPTPPTPAHVDPTTKDIPAPLTVAVTTDSLGGDPATRLERLETLHAEGCRHCIASTTHRSIVFGEGDPTSRVLFVGEAPGAEEDRIGRPFVGRSGELLDRMIESVGLTRRGVYIANVVKVRPPENRTPRPDECDACGPWLLSQIAAIRPRVIVALGATPARYLLGTTAGITRLRGSRFDMELGDLRIPVMPTFHPAFVLRRYTEEVRRAVWQDLKEAARIAEA